MPCLFCTNELFRELSMDAKDLLSVTARQIIDGMLMTARSKPSIKPPPRRGVCIVERCAQFVEAACGGCRNCSRCSIAAELRAAEDQINADRDTELAALGIEDQELDMVVNQFVDGLCQDHVPFGTVLAGEWYSRRSFSTATAI